MPFLSPRGVLVQQACVLAPGAPTDGPCPPECGETCPGPYSADFRVREPFTYEIPAGPHRGERIVVPACRTTDFASVPRLFAWYLPVIGTYTRPAVVHDHLWRSATRDETGGTREPMFTIAEADAIFRMAMQDEGVGAFQRWVMWGAVRWAALIKNDPVGRKTWLRDSWPVIPLTVVAGPVAAVPALVILPAWGVFLVFEWVGFWLEKLTRLRRRRAAEDTPVNRPNPSLRT